MDTRRRRERDHQAILALARSLAANAAYALACGLEPPTVGIALRKPRGARQSRYDGPSLRPIETVLHALSPRLVTIARSRRKGVVSALTPGGRLSDCVSALPGFGIDCFRSISGETVIVHRVERDYATNARFVANVDYEDSDETRQMRADVERINAALETADLSFESPHALAIRQRRLRRIFSTYDSKPRFDRNGRLHGGWWQTVEREQRHRIRINGLPVADLDYSAMFLRLAYAGAGVEPPPGDLYAGIVGGPEKARYREGVKQVVNAMLARNTPLTRLPKGSKEHLPSGCTGRSIRDAILTRHSPIRDRFESDAAMRFMRTESDILVAALLRLLDLGVVALPMHDGLMVRRDKADEAATVMREVSLRVTGFELPVTEKSSQLSDI